MKIVSVDVMQVPSGNAGASRGDWSPVIVRVNTDEGISGFGEVGLAYGKGWRAGYGMVQDFAEVIIGEDPRNIELIWERIFRTTFWGLGGGTVVNAAISALAGLVWLRIGNERDRPFLELVLVPRRQITRGTDILRHTNGLKFDGRITKGIAQPPLDQRYCQMRHINADPLAAQFLRRMNRGAAATKGVKDHIARIGRGGNDALQQGNGFLRGIAKAFLGLGIQWSDISPNRAHSRAFHFREISLYLRSFRNI